MTLRILVAPREGNEAWEYYAERIQDPDRRVVYAHRWGNPFFTYSHATWQYEALPNGQTKVRCVQDFEVSGLGKASDLEIEKIIHETTKAALRKIADDLDSI